MGKPAIRYRSERLRLSESKDCQPQERISERCRLQGPPVYQRE
jgi:hypothetical protein